MNLVAERAIQDDHPEVKRGLKSKGKRVVAVEVEKLEEAPGLWH